MVDPGLAAAALATMALISGLVGWIVARLSKRPWLGWVVGIALLYYLDRLSVAFID